MTFVTKRPAYVECFWENHPGSRERLPHFPGLNALSFGQQAYGLFVKLPNGLLDLFTHTDGVALRLEDNTVEGVADENDGQVFGTYKSG